MMRLRVRFDKRKTVVEVDGEQSVTFFKENVSEHFGIAADNFILTLNGKDPLTDSDDDQLSTLGLVSGDLIKLKVVDGFNMNGHLVVCDQRDGSSQSGGSCHASGSGQASESGQACGSSQACGSRQAGASNARTAHKDDIADGYIIVNKDEIPPVDNNGLVQTYEANNPSNSHKCHSLEDVQMNENISGEIHTRHEPLSIKNSDGVSVTCMLQRLWDAANPGNASDALVLALHALMLESGFILHQTISNADEDQELSSALDGHFSVGESSSSASIILPEDWRSPGCHRFSYNYRSCDLSHVCHLTCVAAGSNLVVNGMAKGNSENYSYNFKVNQYVKSWKDGPCYKNLSQLSRLFHVNIAGPLVHQIKIMSGLPVCEFHTLPTEILLNVLRYLDVVSIVRVSETSKHFNDLCEDDLLWQFLLLRDFGIKTGNGKTSYKQKHVSRETLRLRRGSPEFLHMPSYLPARRPPIYPPGYRGGAFDLDPFSAMGILPLPVSPVYPSLRPYRDIHPGGRMGPPQGRLGDRRGTRRALPGFGGSGFFM